MNGLLPSFMRFSSAKDLVRVGRDNDGGYLVSQSDINASDTLVGLGINDDWSFETDFCRRKDVAVLAYDASVSKALFRKRLIMSLFRLHKPRILRHWIKVYFSYGNFFTGRRRHIEKFVGLNAKGAHCPMDAVFDETTSCSLFLKIDIEGSEYRILDTLLANQNRITGMVIEFHDCDLHLEKIEQFLEKLEMQLVHVHANNYGPISRDNLLPLVLELTFSTHADIVDAGAIPHQLDMPNNKFDAEITLRTST